MGFLKVKEVKGHKYFCWCKRIRSSKKHGGSGKVRSIDLLIGRDVTSRRLAYYLDRQEIEVKEYISAYLEWETQHYEDSVVVSLTWNKDKFKLSLRSNSPAIDCRSAVWKSQRAYITNTLKYILSLNSIVSGEIKNLTDYIRRYEQYLDRAKKARQKAIEIRKTKDATWTELEERRDEWTGDYHSFEVTYGWLRDADIAEDERADRYEEIAAISIAGFENGIKALCDQYPPATSKAEFEKEIRARVDRQLGKAKKK